MYVKMYSAAKHTKTKQKVQVKLHKQASGHAEVSEWEDWSKLVDFFMY